MNIADVYADLAPRFDRWVRTMEIQTRRLELEDALLGDARSLIISPPTDPAIRMIAAANEGGTSSLLCWSERLRAMAASEERLRGLQGLQLLSAIPPAIPIGDGQVDVVFANCLFDFCEADEIAAVLAEISRVLRPGGALLAVYMGRSPKLLARLWGGLFKRLPSVSRGCRPVDILPALRRHGFEATEERRLRRFGFPISYVRALRVARSMRRQRQ